MENYAVFMGHTSTIDDVFVKMEDVVAIFNSEKEAEEYTKTANEKLEGYDPIQKTAVSFRYAKINNLSIDELFKRRLSLGSNCLPKNSMVKEVNGKKGVKNSKFVVLQKDQETNEIFIGRPHVIARGVFDTEKEAEKFMEEYNKAVDGLRVETNDKKLYVNSVLFYQEIPANPASLQWDVTRVFNSSGNIFRTSIALRDASITEFYTPISAEDNDKYLSAKTLYERIKRCGGNNE